MSYMVSAEVRSFIYMSDLFAKSMFPKDSIGLKSFRSMSEVGITGTSTQDGWGNKIGDCSHIILIPQLTYLYTKMMTISVGFLNRKRQIVELALK